jgi:hypothetical protein
VLDRLEAVYCRARMNDRTKVSAGRFERRAPA